MKISFYKYALLSMVTSSTIVNGQPPLVFFEDEWDRVLAASTAIPHQEAGQARPLHAVEAEGMMAPPIHADETQGNHDILPITQDNALTQAMDLETAVDTPPPSGEQGGEAPEEFVFSPTMDFCGPSTESDESSEPRTPAEGHTASPLMLESSTLDIRHKQFTRERTGAVSGTSDLTSPEPEAASEAASGTDDPTSPKASAPSGAASGTDDPTSLEASAPSEAASGTDNPTSLEASAAFIPDVDTEEADERLLQAKRANQAHASHSTSSLQMDRASSMLTQAQPSPEALENITEKEGACSPSEPSLHNKDDTTPPESAAEENHTAAGGEAIESSWRRWFRNLAGCFAFFRGSRS